jgi:hypothetical protein
MKLENINTKHSCHNKLTAKFKVMEKREYVMARYSRRHIPFYQPNGHEEQSPPLHLGHFAKP